MPQLVEIMRPDLIEVAPEDTLGEVADRMTAVNVGGHAVGHLAEGVLGGDLDQVGSHDLDELRHGGSLSTQSFE